MTRWTSRKLIVAIVAALLATAMLALNYIDPEMWERVFGLTIGAYLASQGLTDAAGALKK